MFDVNGRSPAESRNQRIYCNSYCTRLRRNIFFVTKKRKENEQTLLTPLLYSTVVANLGNHGYACNSLRSYPFPKPVRITFLCNDQTHSLRLVEFTLFHLKTTAFLNCVYMCKTIFLKLLQRFFLVYGVPALVLNLQQSVRLTRGGGGSISESLPLKRYRELRIRPLPISYYTEIYGGRLAKNQSRNLQNLLLKILKNSKTNQKILIKNHFKHDSFRDFFLFSKIKSEFTEYRLSNSVTY